MTLIRHELRRAWKALLIWTLALSGFLVVCLFIYPDMKKEMNSISSLMSGMGAFSAAFGMDTLNFGTLIGYYGIECGNILGLGGAFFAALLGINALAREEKDKTAEFLLTHPLSRTEVITAKLAAILVQVVLLNAGVYLLSVGSIAAIGEAIPWKEITLLHTGFFLMQIELACVCFGISACLWRGGLGIGLGLAVGMYFLNIIANLLTQANLPKAFSDFLKHVTPFGYADGPTIISNGSLDGTKLLIGLGFTLLGVGLAYYRYRRKDIR